MTGAELKAWRARLGWTQERAAAELGVPLQTLRAWEIDRYRITKHPRIVQLACERLTDIHASLPT